MSGAKSLVVTPAGGNRTDVTQLFRWSTPHRRSADDASGPAAGRGSCSPTGATTTTSTHGSGLGRHRWVVERGFAWLHSFKRLRTRYERRADIHLGLLQLACALICYRHLPSF